MFHVLKKQQRRSIFYVSFLFLFVFSLFSSVKIAHASLSLSLDPSRTSGVAPLAVFFDASGTTSTATSQPFHELEYSWNFGDNDVSVWNYGTHTGDHTDLEKKNYAKGPVAAHVFEFPGTYTVTLTVYDGTVTETTTQVITVTNPTTVFGTTNTICIAAATTPVAGSDGCPSGAAVYQQSDWPTIISTYVATGKRILLKHDDTFTVATTPSITVTGPGTIGMYGTGAKPILQATADITALIQLSSPSTPGIGDWRFTDLEFDANGYSASAIVPNGGIDQVTYLRLYSHVTSYSFLWNTSILDYWNSHGSPGHTIYDQIAMVDCKTFGSYTSFVEAKRLMIMGNNFNNNLEGEHTIRVQYANGAVISNNTLQGQAPTKEALTIRAGSYGDITSVAGLSSNGVSQNIEVADNKIIGNAGDNWTTYYGPQGSVDDERINNVITERNWFIAGSGTAQLAVFQAANHTIRNNIFDNTAGGGPITISANPSYVPATWSNHVMVYNNTMYANNSNASFDGVSIQGGSSYITLKNNIAYAPGVSYDAFYRCDGSRSCADMTGFVASNNSTDTDSTDQIKSTDPLFLDSSGTLSVPADFHIKSDSYAKDSGASVPVWSDFSGVTRPYGTSYDLGAYEYSPFDLSFEPSRTTGVAPLAVFFDASGTTDTGVTSHPFHEIEYTWNFGDDDTPTWSYGAHVGDSSDLAKKNRAKGPVSAHVFETPGTYTVTLTAYDGALTGTTTQEIVVSDPNSVFSGTNTICFSVVGDFTDCPSGAQTITASSFESIIDTYLGTNKRLLLHRGETFTSVTSAHLNDDGPWTVGAYGSGAKPIVHNGVATGAYVTMATIGSGTGGSFLGDGRLMDIVMDAGDGVGGITGVKTTAFMGGRGTFDQMTFLRTDITNMNGGFSWSSTVLSQSPADRMWDQLTIQDSTVYNLTGSGGVGMFLSSKRMAILGNSIDNNGAAEHNFRSMYWNKLALSNNTFANPGITKGNITLRAPNYKYGDAINSFDTWSEYAVVSDNELTGTGVTISAATFDDTGIGEGDQRRRDAIFERNWLHDQPNLSDGFSLASDFTTVRSNIVNLGSLSAKCISITGGNPNYHFGTDWVYNNTCYTTSSGDAWHDIVVMRVYNTVGAVTFSNNLVYTPNITGTVYTPMIDAPSGPVTLNNNSTATQAKNSNPLWTNSSGTFSSPLDFRFSPSSYVRDAGLSIPAFSDFLGNPRIDTYDLGAFEFTVPDTTPPTLTEITPIGSTEDTTPDYTFSTTEAGTIAYGGDCTSDTTTATSGNNTITLSTLSVATHTNCTLTITDSSNNPSTPLALTSFTITAPAPVVITPPATTSSSSSSSSSHHKSKKKKKKSAFHITIRPGERVKPWITVIFPKTNALTTKNFTVSAVASDRSGIQVMTVSLNGTRKKNTKTGSITYTMKKLTNGTVSVTAYDTLGNPKIAAITIVNGRVAGVRYY